MSLESVTGFCYNPTIMEKMNLESSSSRKTPAEIHRAFSCSLDSSVVLAQYNDPLDLGEGFFQLYSEMILGDLEYQVCEKKSETEPRLIFNLLDSSMRNIDSLSYRKEGDSSNAWNMHHRVITTKNLGISGSDFLEKSESYMKILQEKGLIQIDRFTANVSQPSVIAWLEKNGFQIKVEDQPQLSNVLALENGIYTPKEGYEMIPSFEQENNLLKDPYLVKEDLFKSGEALGEIKDFLIKKDGKFSFYFKNSEEEGIVMKKLVAGGYIPRLHFEKTEQVKI